MDYGGKDREIAACELDASGSRRQQDRYRRLGREAGAIKRERDSLTVRFRPTVDEALVAEAIEVERGCCPFFTIRFDAAERRLSFAVGEPAKHPALDAIQYALTHDPG